MESLTQTQLSELMRQHQQWIASGRKIGNNLTLADKDLSGLDFSYAELSGANITRCKLVGCNFQNAKLVSINMTESDFSGADLSFADFTKTDLKYIVLNENTKYEGTIMNGALVDTYVYSELPEFLKKQVERVNINEFAFQFDTAPEILPLASELVDFFLKYIQTVLPSVCIDKKTDSKGKIKFKINTLHESDSELLEEKINSFKAYTKGEKNLADIVENPFMLLYMKSSEKILEMNVDMYKELYDSHKMLLREKIEENYTLRQENKELRDVREKQIQQFLEMPFKMQMQQSSMTEPMYKNQLAAPSPKIAIKLVNNRTKEISVDKIAYCHYRAEEKFKDADEPPKSVHIYLHKETEPYISHENIGTFAERLKMAAPNAHFLKCHKHYILNVAFVDSYGRGNEEKKNSIEVQLKGMGKEHIVLVSQINIPNFKQMLERVSLEA
jgi:hypothetical protein